MRYCLKFIGILAYFVSLPILAEHQTTNQIANKRDELNSVRSKIAETHKNLGQTKHHQENIQAELTSIDNQSSTLTASLILIQQKIDSKKQRLKENTFALIKLKKSIAHQKKKLGDQLASAYRIGSQDRLKLFLNQDDTTLSNRMLAYHNYLTQERFQKVAQFNQDIEQLARLDTELHRDNLQLSEALNQKQTDQAKLQQLKNDRTALLKQLDAQYSVDQSALHHLQNDEQQLNTLLENLQRAEQQIKAEAQAKEKAARAEKARMTKELAERQTKLNSEAALKPNNPQNETKISSNQLENSAANRKINANETEAPKQPPDTSGSFSAEQDLSQLKGRLTWPVSGKKLKTFGSPRFESHWEGVLIGATTGQKVRALANGRVVYAGWMRSYGMLIIINHGKGYMSVYAFNESLSKSVGATVHAGEIIASVGQSGGQPSSALYFEIRLEGKPLDPSEWCKY